MRLIIDTVRFTDDELCMELVQEIFAEHDRIVEIIRKKQRDFPDFEWVEVGRVDLLFMRESDGSRRCRRLVRAYIAGSDDELYVEIKGDR